MDGGKVTLTLELDDRQFGRELEQLQKRLDRLNEKINAGKNARSPLVEQAARLGTELDRARVKLERLEQSGTSQTQSAITEQRQAVEELQNAFDTASAKAETCDAAIKRSALELELAKERAGGMAKEMAATEKAPEALGTALEQAKGRLSNFGRGLQSLAGNALVFAALGKAVSALGGWLKQVIQDNDETAAAAARLKNALLAVLQPLTALIIPAFLAFAEVLIQVANTVTAAVAGLFGGTAKEAGDASEALNEEEKALKGVGSAARKSGRSLASFDTLNRLAANGTAAGGTKAAQATAPVVAMDETGLHDAKELVDQILTAVSLVAGILGAWKIGSALQLSLFKSLSLFLAIEGVIVFVSGLLDAFANGVSWKNLRLIVGGAMVLITGIGIALGTVAAIISSVITGVLMLAAGFNDVIKTGATLENTLLVIAGIIATGLGISLLLKGPIPLLVAGILSIIYAIVAWQENAQDLAKNFQLILGGILDFLLGVFTLNWERAWNGLKHIFIGVANSLIVIFESVVNGIIDGLNWIANKANAIFGGIDIPDGMGGVMHFQLATIPKLSLDRIPALARGAVIPPNREFLAVLGDQTSGTNVEAPLSTIEQAVDNVLARRSGRSDELTLRLVSDRGFVRSLKLELDKESQRKGVKLVRGSV